MTTFPKVHANQLDAVTFPTNNPAISGDSGKVVILDSNGKLPALDATNLFNVPSAGGGSVSSVGISTSSSGVTVGGGPIVGAGTLTVNINSELQGLSGLSANGFVQRTGAGTYTSAALTSTQISLALGYTPGPGSVTSVNISGGSTGLTASGGPITGTGTITLAGTLGIASGGTGQTTASGAINALVPTQTSNSGKVLSTNGTTVSWVTPNAGTVTSVGITAGTGISISGSPITSSGSITVTNVGVTSLTGTTNQVNVSSSTGSVTLSLPQSIATSSSPTFSGLTLAGTTNAALSSNVSTYSSLSISGSANGYAGIQFPAVTGTRTFMFSTTSGLGGVYSVGAAVWDWYYDQTVSTFRVNNGTSLVLTQGNASGNYVSSIASGTGISVSATTGGVVVSTNASSNVQFNSLGIGTPASGTTGEIRATNDITAFYSSDRSLKDNIKTIESAMNKVIQLRGVEFDWSPNYIESRGGEDGYFVRRHDIGVIAQEIEAIIPEVVATRPDGIKAVKYDRLVAVLIEAVKELDRKVSNLSKKECK